MIELIALGTIWVVSIIYLARTSWVFMHNSKDFNWLMMKTLGYMFAPFLVAQLIRERRMYRAELEKEWKNVRY